MSSSLFLSPWGLAAEKLFQYFTKAAATPPAAPALPHLLIPMSYFENAVVHIGLDNSFYKDRGDECAAKWLCCLYHLHDVGKNYICADSFLGAFQDITLAIKATENKDICTVPLHSFRALEKDRHFIQLAKMDSEKKHHSLRNVVSFNAQVYSLPNHALRIRLFDNLKSGLLPLFKDYGEASGLSASPLALSPNAD